MVLALMLAALLCLAVHGATLRGGYRNQDDGASTRFALRGASLEASQRAPTVPRGPRIKAYFVNLESSAERARCMSAQLARLRQDVLRAGGVLEYERFPAVTFSTCNTPQECMEERPECFPSKQSGFVRVHGARGTSGPAGDANDTEAHLLHGVYGNWCSHLFALQSMMREHHEYDFFMLLEDDVILKKAYFGADLMRLLGAFPTHWALIAVDTFNNPGEASPEPDRMDVDGFRLYSLSRTFGTYWGAHLWLLNSRPLERFVHFYTESPAVPVDWVPKVRHPLHMGMWVYKPGDAFQHDRAPIKKLPECEDNAISRSTIAELFEAHLAPTPLSQVADETPRVVGDAELGAAPWGEIPLLGLSGEGAQPANVASEKGVASVPPLMQAGGRNTHRNLHIFGMYHSGARLLADLFNGSYSAAIRTLGCCPPSPSEPAGKDCSPCWQQALHRMHPQLINSSTFKGSEGHVAVVVVRHPFAVVRSAQRLPMGGLDCGNGTGGSEALTHPCLLRDGPAPTSNYEVPEDICLARSALTAGRCWESLPRAWNDYASGYGALKAMFSEVLEVRYEDLVEYPETVLKRVAGAVGIKSVDAEEASRSTAMRYSIDPAAREKLTTPDYASQYTREEMEALCAQLDRTRMYLYGFHGCQGVWPGFDELVFHSGDWESKRDLYMLKKVPNWDLFEGRSPERLRKWDLPRESGDADAHDGHAASQP